MRLAIAASVLATTSLPRGFAFRKQPNQRLAGYKFDTTNAEENLPLPQLLHASGKGQFSDFRKDHPFHESKWSRGGLLTNDLSVDAVIECVPEVEADVGLLACGTNEYCMEIPGSSLRGVCTSKKNRSDQRVLHYTGEHAEFLCGEDPSPICDCSAWDLESGTGVIQCTLEPGCGEGCGLTVCFSYSFTYINDGVTAMYTYFAGYSGSYEKNITRTGEKDVDGDYSCEIAIDGTACSFCTYFNTTCGSYDCSNVGEGSYDCADGSGYGIYIFDNVPYCNGTLDCNLCAEGEFVADENATAPFPFGAYPCGLIYSLTESGASNNPLLCQYFINYAAESCCHEMFSPTTAPTASFDEESPDEKSADDM